MADFYTTLVGLQPNQQDILEAELLGRQVLEAQFPDLDLREGTALRDTLLRPSAFILALVKKGLDAYLADNSLSAVTDGTSQDVVDKLLSNWFLQRDLGTLAVISARLYFARQKTITLPSGTGFSTDGNLQFYPLTTQVFPASSLTFDSGSNEWFVDVDLQAAQTGAQYNVGQGSLLFFTNFDAYFLRAEINYLSKESIAAETNSQFVARSTNAINTRNLINNPSIVGKIQDTFSFADRVKVVGARDEDMYRDQAQLIFEEVNPRRAIALVGLPPPAGTSYKRAMVTLPDHGFYPGQRVDISGAVPSTFNRTGSSTTSVISVTANTFVYATTTLVTAACTTLPTVRKVTESVYAHMGGMVDVFCSAELESELVQLSLDSDAHATIYGPVVAVERSSVTGGAAPDTLPATYPVGVVSIVATAGNEWVDITTSSSPLTGIVGVTITGLSQTRAISAISCTSRLVAVSCPSHGLVTGDMVEVVGVTPSDYCGKFQVTVMGADLFVYDSVVEILSAGAGANMHINNYWMQGPMEGRASSTFISANPIDPDSSIVRNATNSSAIFGRVWGGADAVVASDATVGYSPSFSLSSPDLNYTFADLERFGNIVTATCTNHSLLRNRRFHITSASSGLYDLYDGVHSVIEVLNPNQFTFAVDATRLSDPNVTEDPFPSVGIEFVQARGDVGFSPRQKLSLQFPISQGGRTVTMKITRFKNLDGVQEFLDSPENRVLCGDYLARGFNLYVVDFHLVAYNGPAPSTATCAQILADYFKAMPTGGTLVLSDVTVALNAGGITNLQTPIGVSFTYYTRDMFGPERGVVRDYLDPRDPTAAFALGSVVTSSSYI